MGVIPIYNSKGSLSDQVGSVKKDVASAGQTGRNLKAIGSALNQVATKWLDTKSDAEKTAFKNNIDIMNDQKVEGYRQNGNLSNISEYVTDVKGIGSSDTTGMVNNFDRAEASNYAQQKMRQTEIKLNGIYREKVVSQFKGDILEKGVLAEKTYRTSSNMNEKNEAKKSYEDFLLMAKNKNYIDPEYYAKKKEDIRKWDIGLITEYAEKNPDGAIAMTEESKTLSAEEKESTVKKIKAITAQKEVKMKIAREKAYTDNEESLADMISDTDSTESFTDKQDKIDALSKAGLITDKGKTRSEKLLYSKDKEGAETNTQDLADMMLLITTLKRDHRYFESGGKNKSIAYFKSIRDIRATIDERQSNGKFSEEDYKELKGKVNSTVANNVSAATSELAKQDKWSLWDEKDAYAYFIGALPNEAISQVALREFFYETNGKELTDDGRKKEAAKIAKTVKERYWKDAEKKPKTTRQTV